MLAQVPALEKHSCPACGAQAEWNPAKQKLICPFCGTESPYRIDRETGLVVERDLVSTLRTLPDDARGWQTERRSVECQSCRAVMVFDPTRVGQNCEFCGAPTLVDYNELKSPVRPTGVLPFRVDRNRIRHDIRQWWRTKWLAPRRLARTSLVDAVRSVYIPYWTFDARAHCPWTAEAGHHYYVHVDSRDAQGRRIVRREQRIRWEPASGTVDHAFDDDPVPGTRGIPLDLLRRVEPFPTSEVMAYDTALLSGHVVEHYRVVLFEAAEQSIEQMHAKLKTLCARQVPGDTCRNLRIAPEFSNRTFKHVLVPLWLLTYTHGAKTFQVVVNGYTGRIAGRYPYSAWKIALLVALAAAVLAVLALVTLQS